MIDISNISGIINKLIAKSDSGKAGDTSFAGTIQKLMSEPEKLQSKEELSNIINQLVQVDDINFEQKNILEATLKNLPLSGELPHEKSLALPDLLQTVINKINSELTSHSDKELIGLTLSDIQNIKIGDKPIIDIVKGIVSDLQSNPQSLTAKEVNKDIFLDSILEKIDSVVSKNNEIINDASIKSKTTNDLHSVTMSNLNKDIDSIIENLHKLKEIITTKKHGANEISAFNDFKKSDINDGFNLKFSEKSEYSMVQTKLTSELSMLKNQELSSFNTQGYKNLMSAFNNNSEVSKILLQKGSVTSNVNFTTSNNAAALESYGLNFANNTQPFGLNQIVSNKFGVRLDSPMQSLDWSSSLANKIVWVSQQNLKGVDIHINPPELGPIDLKLQMKNEQTTIQFTSQHLAVREALEQAMPKIKELFSDNGLNLAEYDISDQTSLKQNQQKQNNKSNEFSHSFNASENSNNEQDNNEFASNKIVNMMNIIDYYA